VSERNPVALRRSLSLGLLVLYGLGTTIGAGIYALTGEVAREAGLWAPLSFLTASLLAALTALTFAEFSSRHPKSAGEAVYVAEGLGWPGLPLVVGLLVVLTGVVSAATVTNGFVGYLGELVDLPRAWVIVALALALGGVAAWGVGESVWTASAITLVEILGLVVVVAAAGGSLAELPSRAHELLPPFEAAAWGTIAAGGVLAFYAFLGFEDMVNVAEEVVDAPRTMPRAIVITLVLTTLLYVAVALVSVLAVPPAELAASDAPLALVYERSTGQGTGAIAVIGVLAMVNGALIQVIMASRVLYGLAAQHWLPARIAYVHPRTRTPLVATAIAALAVAVLALGFGLGPLARTTSRLMLVIFALVNLALVFEKRRAPPPEGVTVFPVWVPAGGFVVTVGFAGFELWGVLSG